jgi:hypothetical protein
MLKPEIKNYDARSSRDTILVNLFYDVTGEMFKSADVVQPI